MKHLQQNQEFRLNEILFENRNKQYGAYVLRNESDRILTKSLFIGVSLLAAISITPMIISTFRTVEINERDFTPVPPVMIDVEKKDPPAEVVPPKTVTPPPPSVRQYDSQVVTPTRDADESKIVKDIPKDAIAGVKNDFIAPPATTINIPTTIISGPGTITPPKVTPSTGPDNSVKEGGELSVEAQFADGIESFRNKVMNKFDNSDFESDYVMKTTITFIVERDGTISGIKADGKNLDFNAEALRTIKSIKGKWIPGKNKKGEAVRSYFKFPISMKFDN
ncbi:hypothetical protein CHRY9390_00440 [Chryseobacterium aquaeductus]|uniref:Energy transducer TonB n=1 Tax=Chryseobacterium aquaeductus TaxID=2675056 RepID=A0A9N8MDW9_9FLAO|nr:energy transducer TonB [Chryseobacterium aquaeductus]CAA7329795.1 hypothetical protein CHRY9390_00440 [Chryseobacterium potabilaquae]CAD7799136.1 hypothetical protein CHRY9390_00440 [Chryseobacterium aquaeductus]